MPDPAESQEKIAFALSPTERDVLRSGLREWGGPAHCNDAMARAMGFESVDRLLDDTDRLDGDLAAGSPLTPRDWTRVLLATEIVFASDVVGSGVEWETTTGLDDCETIRVLRGLQRRLVEVRLGEGAWVADVPPRRSRRRRPGRR